MWFGKLRVGHVNISAEFTESMYFTEVCAFKSTIKNTEEWAMNHLLIKNKK